MTPEQRKEHIRVIDASAKLLRDVDLTEFSDALDIAASDFSNSVPLEVAQELRNAAMDARQFIDCYAKAYQASTHSSTQNLIDKLQAALANLEQWKETK